MPDQTDPIDPTVADKPIVGTSSSLPGTLKSVGAALLIITASWPTAVAVLGSHDVTKIAAWLASDGLVQAIGAVTLLATVGASAWERIKKDTNLARLLRLPQVPNTIGYVKGDPGTPVAPGSNIIVKS